MGQSEDYRANPKDGILYERLGGGPGATSQPSRDKHWRSRKGPEYRAARGILGTGAWPEVQQGAMRTILAILVHIASRDGEERPKGYTTPNPD